MVNINGAFRALILAQCIAIGSCFGAAVGLIVGRLGWLTLIGAIGWFMFGMFAILA
jgi:hypothetical protein